MNIIEALLFLLINICIGTLTAKLLHDGDISGTLSGFMLLIIVMELFEN